MTRTKEDSLKLLALRILRLKENENRKFPESIIDKEKELISSLFDSGELEEEIRLCILDQVARRIRQDQLQRIGALGNRCTDCAFWGKCDKESLSQEEIEKMDLEEIGRACKKFIRKIEPSKEGQNEQILVNLDGTYGINKDRDLPIVREWVKHMKSQQRNRR